MFRKFRVQNFMCLKDVTVELEPLTIFAGPNSSGKSAFFKALSCFSRLLWYPASGGPTGDFNVEFGATLDDVVWKGDSSFPMSFQVWFCDNSSDEPDYTLVLRRDYTGWKVEEKFLYQGQWLDTSQQTFEFPTSRGPSPKVWSGPYNAPLAYLTHRYRLDNEAAPLIEPIRDLRVRLGEARRYRPSANDIAYFVKASPLVGARASKEPEVDEAGRRLAVVLRDLLTTDRVTFGQVEEELRRLHGHIDGINFKSDWRGVGIYYKTARTGEDIPASLESDGVLLTTFILWRLYTAPPNFKLCLEEPETGVHLWGMTDRYQLLKQFVMQDNNRRNLQILVATHSRDFLNAIRSRTDILTAGACGGVLAKDWNCRLSADALQAG